MIIPTMPGTSLPGTTSTATADTQNRRNQTRLSPAHRRLHNVCGPAPLTCFYCGIDVAPTVAGFEHEYGPAPETAVLA